MKKSIVIIFLFVCIFSTASLWAQGEGFSFQFGMGFQGSFSYFEAGINTPVLADSVFIGLKARLMSSLTWATFIHQDGRSVSFHPVTAAGILSVGGYSPMLRDTYRMYGYSDFLLGYTFTPYDNMAYGTGNLLGPNLTFGVLGNFGIELFTAETMSYLFNAGGGLKMIKGDRENLYVIGSNWLGSGIGMMSGMRFYL